MRVDGNFRDKRLINFNLVEWEVLEPRQRGIPGAEVIDGDAHSERLEITQQRDGLRWISFKSSLGDLKFQPARGKSGFREREPDQIDQLPPLPELRRRKIDGNSERIGPCGGVAACLPQDPTTDGKNQTAVLGERDKLRRWNLSVKR